MPRYKAKGRGEGARYEQAIYQTDPDGKKVVAYHVWRGYDWVSTPSGELVKVSAQGKRGQSRADLDAAIKAKAALIPTDQTAYVKRLEEEIAALKSQIARMIERPAVEAEPTYPTFAEIVAAYLDSPAAKRKSGHGNAQLPKQRGMHRNYLLTPYEVGVPPFGELIAARLRTTDLQTLDSALQRRRRGYKLDVKTSERTEETKDPLSPKSFGHLLALFGQALEWARSSEQAEWSGVTSNVAREYIPDRNLNAVGKDAKNKKTLSAVEILATLDGLKAYDEPLCAVAALVATGERPNAMRSLEWGQYDEKRQSFLLDGQWVVVKGERKYVAPKNKKIKEITIPDALLPYVTVCREWSGKWVVPTSKRLVESNLNHSIQGRRWNAFKKLKGNEHLEDMDLYDFKHSIATAAFNSGESIDAVANALGVIPSVAKGHYIKLQADQRKEFLERVYKVD